MHSLLNQLVAELLVYKTIDMLTLSVMFSLCFPCQAVVTAMQYIDSIR